MLQGMKAHGMVLKKDKENNQEKQSLPDRAEIFLLYLETQKNMASATIRAYATDLLDFNNFIVEQEEKNLDDIKNITKKDIQLYLADLHKKEYSKTSVSRKLSSLRAFFNYALRKHIINVSPIASIKNPKQPKYHPNVPNVEQVTHILDVPQKQLNEENSSPKEIALFSRNIALVELLYGSGLRISEALNLNKADFSEEKSSIIVTGKGNKKRVVPLTEKSKIVLKTWLTYYSVIGSDISSDYTSPLFIGARGSRLNRREALRIIEKLEKQEGTPHLSAHSFRHAYATHLLESGLDLRTVQELLGHARIATTQVYTHLNLTHLIDVYKKAHPKEE